MHSLEQAKALAAQSPVAGRSRGGGRRVRRGRSRGRAGSAGRGSEDRGATRSKPDSEMAAAPAEEPAEGENGQGARQAAAAAWRTPRRRAPRRRSAQVARAAVAGASDRLRARTTRKAPRTWRRKPAKRDRRTVRREQRTAMATASGAGGGAAAAAAGATAVTAKATDVERSPTENGHAERSRSPPAAAAEFACASPSAEPRTTTRRPPSAPARARRRTARAKRRLNAILAAASASASTRAGIAAPALDRARARAHRRSPARRPCRRRYRRARLMPPPEPVVTEREHAERPAAPLRLVGEARARQGLSAPARRLCWPEGRRDPRDGSRPMKSGWVDSDAQAIVDRYARARRRPRSRVARLHARGCSAAIRSSCCTAAATPR